MSHNILRSASLLAAAMASGVLGEAEVQVLPRPEPRGLGEWIRRNNKRRETKGAFGAPKAKQRRQRLQRAVGPGSYDEWKAALAAKRAAARSGLNGT